jgi:methylmalonyl-CoA/ethylmalonyl-CoA epimerase
MLGLPIHHVGVACADIDATAEYMHRAYRVKSDSGTIFDPAQDASVRLLDIGSAVAIELVSGTRVASFVKKGITYYHICYATRDIEETIAQAQDLGAMLVGPLVPAILFGGKRVVYVFTELGLVEFLED